MQVPPEQQPQMFYGAPVYTNGMAPLPQPQYIAQPVQHHKKPHIKTKFNKRVNQVFVGLYIAMIIAAFIITSEYKVFFASWWMYLNLYFLIVKKSAKISFLRCRVCLVYVLFGFVAFANFLYIIVALFIGVGNEIVVNGSQQGVLTRTDEYGNQIPVEYDGGLGRTIVSLIMGYVFVSLGQGISWVVYTCKLTEKHWEKIHHHHHGYTRV